MIIVEDRDKTLHVLDPGEAAALQRRLNQLSNKPSPQVTVTLEHTLAQDLAPAFAQSWLGCKERITPLPSTRAVLLNMRAARQAEFKSLLDQIEALKHGEHISTPASPSRHELWGVAEPTHRPCKSAYTLNYSDIENPRVLGMRLYEELSEQSTASLVMTCGAMEPVHGWFDDEFTPDSWLVTAGFRPVDAGATIWTTQELAQAYTLGDGGLRKPSDSHVVLALRIDQAPLIAAALAEQFPELSPSAGGDEIVLLRGDASAVDAARQFALNLAELY